MKWKTFKDFLKSDLHIISGSPFSSKTGIISLSKITSLAIIVIIIASITIFGYLFQQYRSNYLEARRELNYLRSNKMAELEGVYNENARLKEQLRFLAGDLNQIHLFLQDLHERNQQIEQILSEEVEIYLEEFDMDSEYKVGRSDRIFPAGGPGEILSIDFYDSEKQTEMMDEQIDSLNNDTLTQLQNMQNLESALHEFSNYHASVPTIWPVDDDGEGYITSRFGWRTSPLSGSREFHEGLDIGVWYNTPVLAAAEGEVVFAGWKNGYGYTVKIEHEHGFETLYAHLQEIKVTTGQKVQPEDTIALSGNTGDSTGPHLHYEVIVDGEPQDPLEFITER